MGAMAFHMTSLTIVYSTVYSCADHRTPKLRVSGLCVDIHQWPMNSPHKWPVTRKIIPCDDVILLQWFLLNDKCAVTLLISMFGNHFPLLHGIFLWSYDAPRCPLTKQYLTRIRKSNRIRCFIWNVITHPCSDPTPMLVSKIGLGYQSYWYFTSVMKWVSNTFLI